MIDTILTAIKNGIEPILKNHTITDSKKKKIQYPAIRFKDFISHILNG